MKTLMFIAGLVFLSLTINAGDDYCAKLKDGKMVVMHNGTLLTSDVTFKDGTQVKTDGSVIKKDGSRIKLREEECITDNGRSSKDSLKSK